MEALAIILLVIISLLLLGWLVYLTIRLHRPGVRGPPGPEGPRGPPGTISGVTTTQITLVAAAPTTNQLLISPIQVPSQAQFTFLKGDIVTQKIGQMVTATIHLDVNYTVTGTPSLPVVFEIKHPSEALCTPQNLVSNYTITLPLGTAGQTYNVYPLLTGTGLFSQTAFSHNTELTNAWAGFFVPSTGTSAPSDYRLLVILDLPTFTSGTFNVSNVLTGSWLCT